MEQIIYQKKQCGYSTKWGDGVCDFSPITNFTSSEVVQIGRYFDLDRNIIEKVPHDGLGNLTDEEKLKVTYKQINEYISEGKTDPKAMEIILDLYNKSKHKRNKIPEYYFERKNYLK